MPNYSGDGQRSGYQPTPLPFVPRYSGDGHGRSTGDGQASEPMPIWSGGGRHDVLNPMMPTWGNTNGRLAPRPVDRSPSPTTAATVEELVPVQQIPLSEELMMNVNVRAPKKKAKRSKERSATTQKGSGTWKLIALVVVFLVWVSTASTLLFLYMDRYLFP